VVRGDVHAIVLPKKRGHVQHGKRYAVIVQADDLLSLSTVVVCPTSQSSPPASFHPDVTIEGESTRVLCEMVGAVDARAIGKPVAHLSIDDLAAVDEGLQLVLDLT